MERGSDKHSPRLDDQLEHETEGLVRAGRPTHAEEWRSPEPAGEDQPDVDRAPDETLVGGTPEGMTPADVEGRAELASYLHRSEFPAVMTVLLDAAERAEAPDRVLEQIRQLPAGREYQNVQEVWETLGHHVEAHRS